MGRLTPLHHEDVCRTRGWCVFVAIVGEMMPRMIWARMLVSTAGNTLLYISAKPGEHYGETTQQKSQEP